MPLPKNQYFPSGELEDLAKMKATLKHSGVPGVMYQAAKETYDNPIINNVLAALPVTGEAMLANDVANEWQKGNKWTAGGLGLAGMLPFGGMIGKTVWHGSPHPFSRFDMSKMGTGEGAQAYGAGHYLAEARPVAERYAEDLSNREMANQGRLNAHANARRLANLAGDPKYAADDVRFVLESNPDHPQKQLLSDTLQHLESGSYAQPLENKGYLYKVDLPDEHIAKMIDWDVPFSKQPENVREALKRRITDVQPMDKFDMGGNARLRDNRDGQIDPNSVSPWLMETISENGTNRFGLSQNDVDRMFGTKDVGDLTGEQIVSRIAQERGGQIEASKYLNELGIPGIQYLDRASRDAKDGTRNYVIFSDELPQILERNGQPLDTLK